MQALTICEPWAWAIVDLAQLSPAAKNIENRGEAFPDVTGPLLIHSGKGERYRKTYYEHQITIWRLSGHKPPPFDDIAGRGLIGYVEAVEVLELATLKNLLSCTGPLAERYKFDLNVAKLWAEGPKCLLLAGVCPFEKRIDYRGQQGVFHVPDHLVADQVEYARERAAIRQYGGG